LCLFFQKKKREKKEKKKTKSKRRLAEGEEEKESEEEVSLFNQFVDQMVLGFAIEMTDLRLLAGWASAKTLKLVFTIFLYFGVDL